MKKSLQNFEFGDLIAGISVAMVLIPQSMAYATLAGLPPIYGIYASILPPIIAAFFVSSPYLQTGPVAMTSLLTFGALATIATPASGEYIGLAALLALIVGLVRMLIGLSRSGFIAYLMSQPVITGFTSAAAILIIASQIPAFFGLAPGDSGIILNALSVISHPGDWSIPAIMLGMAAIVIIHFGKKLHPLFPGVLIAVMAGIIYSKVTTYSDPIIGDLPSGLPNLSFNLPWEKTKELLIPGLVIALVGFAEPAAIARTMATQSRQPWSVDKEFISQGMANIATSISGSFPVGGSFSRTMVNFKAGGKSAWSGAITGLTVLACLPMISILALLPKAILAAIVISAVLSLIELRVLYTMFRTSRTQGIVACLTFFLALALAPRIDLAVLIGIILGVAVHLWRERRIEVIQRYEDNKLNLIPVGVLFFGSAPGLHESLIAVLAEHAEAKELILDLGKVGRIDYTGALVLQRFAKDSEHSGLEVTIIPGLPLQGVRVLERVMGKDSPWFLRNKENSTK